jgi:hypothetical protein
VWAVLDGLANGDGPDATGPTREEGDDAAQLTG